MYQKEKAPLLFVGMELFHPVFSQPSRSTPLGLTLLFIGRRRHLDATSSFLPSPLSYTLIMTIELDQVPFRIEKVKHPTVQPTRCI